MSPIGTDSPWVLFAEIALATAILAFLFFRKRKPAQDASASVQRIEIKLSRGILIPSEVNVAVNRPVHLVIYRHDTDPQDELFEIEELKIYELLPALHATIIPLNPTRCGVYPLVLAGEKQAGTLIVG